MTCKFSSGVCIEISRLRGEEDVYPNKMEQRLDNKDDPDVCEKVKTIQTSGG